MHRLIGLVLLLLPMFATADVVVPIESVENHVNVRITADAHSEIVGRLYQGDWMPLLNTQSGWHEIDISGGATGFISADWTLVLAEPPSKAELAEIPVAVEEKPESPEVAVAEESSEEVSRELSEEELQAEYVPATAESGEELEEQEPAATIINTPENVEQAPIQSAIIDTDSKDADVVEDSIEGPADEEPVPAISESVPQAPLGEVDFRGPAGETGAQGPQGETGPAGAASIEGSVGFLVKFDSPTSGESAQVFDDGTNIGIGTTAPKQRLDVNGNIQIHNRNSSVAGLIITQSDGDAGYIMHNRANTLTIGAGSIDRITVDPDGNVGFGVSRPVHPVELESGAHVSAGGVWTNSSSLARKENIEELSLDEAVMTLSQLQPVHFNYKNDKGEKYLGFIADDVPDLVATNDRVGLSPMDIVAVLTKVVQEQQKKITELEARLDGQ